MANSRFKNSGQTNRLAALFFTMFFHTALLGGLYYSSNSETPLTDLLPDVVKEWFNDTEEPAEKKEREGA